VESRADERERVYIERTWASWHHVWGRDRPFVILFVKS
jgi:hypothetical protein